MTKFVVNFTLNLDKVCRKSADFQNKFQERLKVKTSELGNRDQIEIIKIDILN